MFASSLSMGSMKSRVFRFIRHCLMPGIYFSFLYSMSLPLFIFTFGSYPKTLWAPAEEKIAEIVYDGDPDISFYFHIKSIIRKWRWPFRTSGDSGHSGYSKRDHPTISIFIANLAVQFTFQDSCNLTEFLEHFITLVLTKPLAMHNSKLQQSCQNKPQNIDVIVNSCNPWCLCYYIH